MAEFPYDVWLYIISFLTEHELWNLRGVNRFFCSLALDNRYRRINVSLDFPRDKGYVQKFRALGDNHIAYRVRELIFQPYEKFISFDTLFVGTNIAKLSKQAFLESLKQMLFYRFLGADKTMTNVMKHFVNVVTMRVECTRYPLEDGELVRSAHFIHSVIKVFSNLSSLTLSISLDAIPNLIPCSLFLPHLQELSIGLFYFGRYHENPSFKAAHKVIVPFVNRHRISLRSLDFGFRVFGSIRLSLLRADVFNLGPLFEDLERIQHLSSLTLDMTETSDSDSVSRFLQMHANSLRHIGIAILKPNHYPPNSICSLDGFRIPFLQVNSLTLEIQCSSGSTFNYQDSLSTGNFIGQFPSSLVSLKVQGKQHTLEDLNILISRTSSGFSSLTLKFLFIRLYLVTPNVLEFLATNLPNLYELDLVVNRFARVDGTYSAREEYEFCLETRRRSYPVWGLQHLTIRHRYFETRIPYTYCLAAIAQALPSLKTLNEIIREKHSSLADLKSLAEAFPSDFEAMRISGYPDKDGRLPWDS